jgi:ABC-type transport system involved in Fe-S cluster assembly fused permease/ATPase subunit
MTTIVHGIATMLKEHWFWGAVTLACLVWYSTVTVYVAIKGAGDIRSMLRRLSNSNDAKGPE